MGEWCWLMGEWCWYTKALLAASSTLSCQDQEFQNVFLLIECQMSDCFWGVGRCGMLLQRVTVTPCHVADVCALGSRHSWAEWLGPCRFLWACALCRCLCTRPCRCLCACALSSKLHKFGPSLGLHVDFFYACQHGSGARDSHHCCCCCECRL